MSFPQLMTQPVSASRSSVLQRRCACGGTCDDCKTKKLQWPIASANSPAVAPPIVHDVLDSPGQPLDHESRSFFEPRFGHSFGNVRVHTDEKAAESARAVNALAYTVGQSVVFDRGQFAPRSRHGRSLLAHELTHVVQQGNRNDGRPPRLGIEAGGSFEHEAERTAHAMFSGRATLVAAQTHTPVIQRQSPQGGQGGPDYGISCDIFKGECKLTVGGVDIPLNKEQYRCWLLARSGNCPKECEDTLKDINVSCVQMPKPVLPPTKPGGGPTLPSPRCRPGETPYMGGCLPPLPIPHPEPQPGPTLTPGLSPRPKPRLGTIESATLDNFAVDDPTVPSQHSGALDHLVALLNIYSDVTVHIEGHTDGSGTETINTPLSLKRAEAVKAALIARKIVNPGRIVTKGFSSHQPLVKPGTPQAYEPRNRRVEVWYYIPPLQSPLGGAKVGPLGP